MQAGGIATSSRVDPSALKNVGGRLPRPIRITATVKAHTELACPDGLREGRSYALEEKATPPSPAFRHIFLARIQHDLLRASSTTKSFPSPCIFNEGKPLVQSLYIRRNITRQLKLIQLE